MCKYAPNLNQTRSFIANFWYKKNNTNRKIKILIFLLVALSCNISLYGQCTNTSSYGSATLDGTSAVQTISTCQWAGTEYATVSNAVAGTSIVFTHNAGSYITIHSGTYNGTVLASGWSPLTISNTYSGTLFAHYNTNASCGTESGTCYTTTVQCSSCQSCVTPDTPTAAGATSICAGTSTNISATSTNATTIYWYTGSCGGTLVGTSSPGANFPVSPASTTTYYAKGYNSLNTGCWSSGCGSVTITAGSATLTTTTTLPSGTTATTSPSTPGAALGLSGGLTYTYTNSSWPTCINWGLPTTVAAVNLDNSLPPNNSCVFNNLIFDAANGETNLTAGKACFTGTYNYYCANTSGSYLSKACNIRMRVVVTKSDGVTALPFTLFGSNLLLQAKENFIVKVYIEGYAYWVLYDCLWSVTDYYSSYVNGGWPGVVDIFNSLHTDPTHSICTQFSPNWYTVNSSPTASSNSPVCTTNTLTLSGSSLIGAGCFANWSGPNGFTSTLPNPTITGVTTAAAGTYNLVISDGKACYGTTSTSVTINTQSSDPTSINADVHP